MAARINAGACPAHISPRTDLRGCPPRTHAVHSGSQHRPTQHPRAQHHAPAARTARQQRREHAATAADCRRSVAWSLSCATRSRRAPPAGSDHTVPPSTGTTSAAFPCRYTTPAALTGVSRAFPAYSSAWPTPSRHRTTWLTPSCLKFGRNCVSASKPICSDAQRRGRHVHTAQGQRRRPRMQHSDSWRRLRGRYCSSRARGCFRRELPLSRRERPAQVGRRRRPHLPRSPADTPRPRHSPGPREPSQRTPARGRRRHAIDRRGPRRPAWCPWAYRAAASKRTCNDAQRRCRRAHTAQIHWC